MKPILFGVFLCLKAVTVLSQGNTEFWFVAPEVYQAHGDRPIYMRISTTASPANIVLRQPASPSFTPITSLILPNSTFSINLTTWIDSIENKPANTILNRGLYLTSDMPVTAYYEEASNSNPELFALKGKNAIGNEFYISGQYNYKNHYPPANTSEAFDIVATEDSTLVTVTVSEDIVGHLKNSTFQVLLNRGQTYSARATSTAAAISLAGSHVVATKPVSVTLSDDSVDEPETGNPVGWDLIGDQTVPVNILGKEYIAVKGFGNANDDRVYMVAVEDSTHIYLDGNAVPATTINKAQRFWAPLSGNTLYIKTTFPVYAYHMSGLVNEAGSAILPQDSCTGSRQIGFFRTGNGTFALMILTKNGNQDSFYLDGNNALLTAADFSVVTGTANAWVYARKTFTAGQVSVGSHIINNTKGKFHMGILNALGGSAEYGFFSDFSNLYLGADRYMCPGDSIVLNGGAGMTSYAWNKLVNGSWVTVDTNQYYTVHDSGYYACQTSGDFCTLSDTIRVSYYSNATVTLGPDRTICEGATTIFDPGQFVFYLWNTGYTGRILTTGQAGQYWVQVTNNNGCIAKDTVILTIDSLPQTPYPVTGNPSVCEGENGVVYSINPLPFSTSYVWTIPPGATGASSTNSISLSFPTSAGSGVLKVHGVNACGSGPDTSLSITVNPLPGPAGIISGPDPVCQGQTGIVYSVPAIANAVSYNWTLPPGVSITAGSGSPVITTNFALNASSGNITVSGLNPCGTGTVSTKTVQVSLFPAPAGPVSGASVVCQGQAGVQYSVGPVTGADSYIWSTPSGAIITAGNGTNIITVSFDSTTAVSGTITVKGHSVLCGDGTASVFPLTVNPLPAPAGIISGNNPVCQGAGGIQYSITPLANSTSYAWTVPAGAVITSGSTTPVITVDFSTSAQSGSITVRGINAQCGNGRSSSLSLGVNPLPLAAGSITGQSTVCQGQNNVIYTTNSIPFATSYIWTFSGTGATLTNLGNNLTVQFGPAATSGSLTVKGQNNCGSGIVSASFPVQVNPISQISLLICNPILTHNSQSFILRGGIPLGGIYSGTGVSGGTFNPALVPSWKDTAVVHYTYTNYWGCSWSAQQTLSLFPVPFFACGNTMTDIRDNTTYPTAQFGSQCWMTANLNYGGQVPRTQVQRDNCMPEKYCLNDVTSNCLADGGLYTWDELMQYNDLPGIQGLCPPGWHIPTDAEWTILFNQFTNIGFAAGALKYTGFSGFNALLSGSLFFNKSWPSPDFLTFFWTSAAHGSGKAWAHGMNSFDPSVSLYPSYRSNAFSVRCLKD